jgi:26S proteasome regulatory subunit N1
MAPAKDRVAPPSKESDENSTLDKGKKANDASKGKKKDKKEEQEEELSEEDQKLKGELEMLVERLKVSILLNNHITIQKC